MTTIEPEVPGSIHELDRRPRGPVMPSPRWNAQLLYQLLIDRFSDGHDADRPLYDPARREEFAVDASAWAEHLTRFNGGTLRGLASRLDYLKALGVTTVWLSPIYKQCPSLETYHGYAAQNFADVDPRFGTRQDLRDLVDAAHARGMYVLLDVVINHAGNVFAYDDHGQPRDTMPYREDQPHPVYGWRAADGSYVDEPAGPEDGVWPRELQNLDWYTRAGQIANWDVPDHEDRRADHSEFRRGDFFDLKTFDHARREVTDAMIRIHQYWIALSDCDGFRLDTVKHLSEASVGRFCRRIREYATAIGKDKFPIVGEVTGGSDFIRDYTEVWGRGIDAFLDIGDAPRLLVDMAGGSGEPQAFFNTYCETNPIGPHRRVGHYISILDDHDMVGRIKQRFAAYFPPDLRSRFDAHATGIQLTLRGVPCIYYGTEQALDGSENLDPRAPHERDFVDRYVRESMFGGPAGGFVTEGCHFFDTDHPAFLRIACIAQLRASDHPIGLALRQGRLYLRDVALGPDGFAPAVAGGVVAWSRVIDGPESIDVIIAFNTSRSEHYDAFVTLDERTLPPDTTLYVAYDGEWSDAEVRGQSPEQSVTVTREHGVACVPLHLPPGGMQILANIPAP